MRPAVARLRTSRTGRPPSDVVPRSGGRIQARGDRVGSPTSSRVGARWADPPLVASSHGLLVAARGPTAGRRCWCPDHRRGDPQGLRLVERGPSVAGAPTGPVDPVPRRPVPGADGGPACGRAARRCRRSGRVTRGWVGHVPAPETGCVERGSGRSPGVRTPIADLVEGRDDTVRPHPGLVATSASDRPLDAVAAGQVRGATSGAARRGLRTPSDLRRCVQTLPVGRCPDVRGRIMRLDGPGPERTFVPTERFDPPGIRGTGAAPRRGSGGDASSSRGAPGRPGPSSGASRVAPRSRWRSRWERPPEVSRCRHRGTAGLAEPRPLGSRTGDRTRPADPPAEGGATRGVPGARPRPCRPRRRPGTVRGVRCRHPRRIDRGRVRGRGESGPGRGRWWFGPPGGGVRSCCL
jgi:hypothetical protein